MKEMLFASTWKENKCTDVELKIISVPVEQVMMLAECKKEKEKNFKPRLKPAGLQSDPDRNL